MPDTIATVDFDRFRLSRLVDRLIEEDEVDIVADPVPLAGVAERLDGNPRAVLFRSVGPEGAALIGNVMGSRARLALALGTGERALLPSMLERLARPIPPIEVTRGTAPVQEVVLEGEDADLTALPVHLQHALDGAPYISAGARFLARSGDRVDQYRHAPADAARPPRGRDRPQRAERSARDLRRGARKRANPCRSPSSSARTRPMRSPASAWCRRRTSSRCSAGCAERPCPWSNA